MKTIHVTETYAPRGGIEKYVIEVSALLQNHGHDNVVLYRREHANTIKRGPCRACLIPCSVDKDEGQARIQRLLQRESPDVIFLHAVYDPVLIQEVARLAPTVGYIHGFSPVCPGLARYYRRGDQICTRPFGLGCVPMIYLRRCTSARRPRNVYRIVRSTRAYNVAYRRLPCSIVGSTYMRDLLMQNGFEADRLAILPPHFEEVHPAVEPQREPCLLLFSGRLEIEKGLPYLLKALAHIKIPCQLLIAGDGTRRGEYEMLADKLGVANRVRFLGWLDEATLHRAYQDATLLVMPTIMPEPFGKVGIEALAHSRPVVAFNVGGIPDWLKDERNGFLVPPRDVVQLAARIEMLLHDNHLAAQFGAHGRAVVEQSYSPERHLEQFLRIFDTAVHSNE